MKKTLLLLSLIILKLGLIACAVNEPFFAELLPYKAQVGTPLMLSETTMVASNELYSLWVDPAYASFRIDSDSGVVWRSLPEYFDDSDWVHNMLIPNVASLITVTSLDASLSRQELHSYEHCVLNGTVTYEAITDGIRFVFHYQRQGITIPLDIYLTNDGFVAQVAPGDIVEGGDFIVNQVMILPYFNSGTSADTGYIFYPDGSGVIAEYNRDYNHPADMTHPVFGFDRGIGTVESISQVEGYRMPVFGTKTNDAAYLAIIDGDASFISSIHSGVNRRNIGYFKNAAIFTYRDVGRVFLRDSQTMVSTSYTIPAPVTATAPFVVRYLLLEGDDIRYSDMAFAYRSFLEQNGTFTERLSSGNTSAHLVLVGALEKPSSFLGIPMNRQINLTTFAEAETIISSLHEAGIGPLTVFYQGAQAGGINSHWTPNFRFNRSLGGEKGFRQLDAKLNDSDDTLFLIGELLQVYRTGQGFSSSRDAARTTGNGLNFQYDYFIQDGSRNTFARRWYLLSPALWHDSFGIIRGNDFMSAADAGRLVYSDYNQKSSVFRDRTGPALVKAMDSGSSNTLALSYGNAYTWELGPILYDVPLGASGFFLQGEEVPFYQLVVHGYIEYSGQAMNLAPDKQLALLRTVEYGAIPQYFGIYAPSAELNRSILAGMFSASYVDWLDMAADQAEQLGDLYQRIRGQRMTGHEETAAGVFRTTYENGVVVTVDYGERLFTVTDSAIP
ncbi:MAG: DUF5696 domain-containing protein [Lachnospiraceae bacterium]|jgi:hypothetical protein|nr:DUF5696 domain-containing protein [Lachnospiraceae bacterium]